MALDLSQVGRSVGSRFSLISGLPTTIVFLLVGLLVLSGAWGGEPSWSAVADRITELSLVSIAVLLFVIVVVALVTHPFQRKLVQLLEGYWHGGGWVAELRLRAVARQIQRRKDFNTLRSSPQPVTWFEKRRPSVIPARQAFYLRAVIEIPSNQKRVMPTELGNVLRYYEDLAGERYGLPAVEMIPRMYPLFSPTMLVMIEDSRNQVDLSARLVWSWLLCTLVSSILLFRAGTWLLLPLGLFCLAWISYRGAIDAARSYGRILVRAVDLYRLDLLEKMGYDKPKDLEEEKAMHEEARRVVAGHAR